MTRLNSLPCLDSEQLAVARRQELNIPREVAAALGRYAVEAAHARRYLIINHLIILLFRYL